MGGVMTVAVRFRDGSMRCQEGWTNSMPFWLQRLPLIEGDEGYVHGFLSSHKRKFIEPYPFEPSEYGIVVVDYLTGNYVEMSDYTSTDHFSGLTLAAEHCGGYAVSVERHDALWELIRAGRIRPRWGRWSGGRMLEDRILWEDACPCLDPATADDFLRAAHARNEADRAAYDREIDEGYRIAPRDLNVRTARTRPRYRRLEMNLEIDMSPLTFSSFSWRGHGWQEGGIAECRAMLGGLGFDVSASGWEPRVAEDLDDD